MTHDMQALVGLGSRDEFRGCLRLPGGSVFELGPCVWEEVEMG